MKRASKNDLFLLVTIWLGIFTTAFLLLLPVLHVEFALARAFAVTTMIAAVHYTNTYLFNLTIGAGKKSAYLPCVFLLITALSFMRYLLEGFVFPSQTQPAFFQHNPFRPVFFIASTGMVCLVSTALLFIAYTAEKEQMLLKQLSSYNEARLQYLHSQINPHFLFNALNNIYSLVITQSSQAPEKLLLLTGLLRHSVYQKTGEKVSVQDEAQQIEFLVELFCLRRDEPYNISFIKSSLTGSMEPMILIPLAENCLKHCDFDLNENAYVKMHLTTGDNGLHFISENSFNTMQTQSDTGGVGIKNIQERLQLVYSDKHQLHISNTESVFKVELTIQWNS